MKFLNSVTVRYNLNFPQTRDGLAAGIFIKYLWQMAKSLSFSKVHFLLVAEESETRFGQSNSPDIAVGWNLKFYP